ncbi:MAG: hypothetical protein QMA97_00445, partial [Glaciecola sp.]
MANYKKTHVGCEHCGSSDGAVINEDASTYCFVCQTHTRGPEAFQPSTLTKVSTMTDKRDLNPSDAFDSAIADRRLAVKTVETFG